MRTTASFREQHRAQESKLLGETVGFAVGTIVENAINGASLTALN